MFRYVIWIGSLEGSGTRSLIGSQVQSGLHHRLKKKIGKIKKSNCLKAKKNKSGKLKYVK